MAKKVAVQKGKVIANPPVMQQMSQSQVNSSDKKAASLRKSGQTLKKSKNRC